MADPGLFAALGNTGSLSEDNNPAYNSSMPLSSAGSLVLTDIMRNMAQSYGYYGDVTVSPFGGHVSGSNYNLGYYNRTDGVMGFYSDSPVFGIANINDLQLIAKHEAVHASQTTTGIMSDQTNREIDAWTAIWYDPNFKNCSDVFKASVDEKCKSLGLTKNGE